jgi:uncharacterized protein
MKDIRIRPARLDRGLHRGEATLEGRWPHLAGLVRLARATPASRRRAGRGGLVAGPGAPVAGGEPRLWLHLQAQATVVHLTCQRCLQPLTSPGGRPPRSASSRRRRSRAARRGERRRRAGAAAPLDLHELVEDELILALPLVPRHESLPGAAAAAADGR